MSTDHTRSSAGDPGPEGPESAEEAELRARYEAEMSQITTTEMMMQAAVSLLNIAARRLGPPPSPAGPGSPHDGTPGGPGAAGTGRDLEQVRDGIDAVRALLAILDRRAPQEIRPLRDALSQLQLAYAREAQSAGPPAAQGPGDRPAGPSGGAPADSAPAPSPSTGEGEAEVPKGQPGPAQASGRLWVPGR